MEPDHRPSAARIRRLAEELGEAGFDVDKEHGRRSVLLTEIDYALRPPAHERRLPSVGIIVDPRADPALWTTGTQLGVERRRVLPPSQDGARRFADGLSSWLLRRADADDEWAVFDRPAGSERDLVVVARAFAATVVQRHPAGTVRIVGDFGVLRWNGADWHHEPPISSWVDTVTACAVHGDRDVLETMLAFAVHDLGARGVGATLIYRPSNEPGPLVQERLPRPPPLDICRPFDLAPLRHALSQVDGAAVLDATGTLLLLGVRLVPSADAETSVDGFRGMRHTSARRYSYDDPSATVIVVSEDGPVTVLRNGRLIGTSPGGAD